MAAIDWHTIGRGESSIRDTTASIIGCRFAAGTLRESRDKPRIVPRRAAFMPVRPAERAARGTKSVRG